ncbi:hypothetical protein DEU56DRAFT_732336, partial [Suillus clintonianus]|uniref:uncharacterized protein n=1 Tax=Suillus clintonianus TaxID=1904413 RepID=UPI001B88128C
PNLIGHVLRQPSVDFQVQTSANDLVPYLQAAEYDIVIGHSIGGLVVISLLKFLSKTRLTPMVLVDLLVELTADEIAHRKDATTNLTAEDYMALNFLWTKKDAIWRVLGTRIGRVNHDYHIASVFASSAPESTVLRFWSRIRDLVMLRFSGV